MKAQELIRTGLATMIAMAGMACASQDNSGGSSTSATVPTSTVTDCTTTNCSTSNYFSGQGGGQATFTPDSMSALQMYVDGGHPLYAPTNFQINVNLYQAATNQWAGQIQIAYTDNGQLYTGTFNTGTGYNQVSYKNWYVGDSDAVFNQWFTYNNASVFHGFFQDTAGAIVLVIDNSSSSALGDGLGGNGTLSGEIYFKNFQPAPGPQFQNGVGERCWFLLPPSPYECGSFQEGEEVVTTSALYPANNYIRLGTFTGLSQSAAFLQ